MMTTTARRIPTPRQFIEHRIVRIVPIYWVLTAGTALAAWGGLSVFGNFPPTLNRLLCSFLFIPEVLNSGLIRNPLVFVGWTLNFEMMFYGLFALSLFVRPVTLRLYIMVGAIAVLWMAQLLGSRNVYVHYLGGDIVLAFALGILLWRLFETLHLPRGLAFAAAPLAIFGLAFIDIFGLAGINHIGLLPIAAGAALVFSGLSLEKEGCSVGPGWISRQGDSSYSLYLIHPFVLQVVGKLAILAGVNSTIFGLICVVIIMFIACGLAAYGLNRAIEMPLTRLLRR
jgi:peptidoglycan/LPS O-acetylase OafA/YrhL